MDFLKINKLAMISFPLLIILSCACSAQASASPSPQLRIQTLPPRSPEPSPTTPQSQISVIWDDDGSPDGLIALLYFLKDPRVRVEAITVSCGEAHPEIFAQNLSQMLARIGQEGIPVAAGRATPLEGNNAFPEPWREATDVFWGVDLPEASQPVEPILASQLIVDVVNQSAEPVAIFLTGNHTNLAEALRLDPSIADRIQVVEVMGGAIYVPGNIASDWTGITNEVAEWNIWVDPVAAAEVFSYSIPIRLVPLDATNHVVWTEEDAAIWEDSGTPEGVVAAEILKWMLDSWFAEGVYAWDVVAAVDLTDPDTCLHNQHFVSVVTEPGDEQGQTIVDNTQPANTSVCMTPAATVMKRRVAEIFQSP